jgi:uncharacterized membrane protein YdbT with pleckstrin-like domain
MDSNNSKNGKVILDTPPHILFLIIPILAADMVWVLYVFLICPLLISPLIDGNCIWVSCLSLLFLIIILALDWSNNRLILTNLRLIRERGIIGKTVMEIRLGKIHDIKVYFGILGRILGFGAIEIESAGTFGKIVFRGIPSPRRIKRLIEKEIGKLEK